jgi:hypothetical protein
VYPEQRMFPEGATVSPFYVGVGKSPRALVGKCVRCATSTINSEGMILIIASPHGVFAHDHEPRLIAGKRRCLIGGADLRPKLVKSAADAHLYPSSTSSWFGLLSQARSSAGPLPVRCGGATRLSFVSGGAIFLCGKDEKWRLEP